MQQIIILSLQITKSINQMKKYLLLLFCVVCALSGFAQKYQLNDEKKVVKEFSYTDKGKKYWVLWGAESYEYAQNPNWVRYIFVVPDWFKAQSKHISYSLSPHIDKIILHDIPGQEFLEAVIIDTYVEYYIDQSNGHEMSRQVRKKYGIRLPDDIADEIIYLTAGHTKYGCNPMLGQYGSTTSKELTPLTTEIPTHYVKDLTEIRKDREEWDKALERRKK